MSQRRIFSTITSDFNFRLKQTLSLVETPQKKAKKAIVNIDKYLFLVNIIDIFPYRKSQLGYKRRLTTKEGPLSQSLQQRNVKVCIKVRNILKE